MERCQCFPAENGNGEYIELRHVHVMAGLGHGLIYGAPRVHPSNCPLTTLVNRS
jgi:hypothetical protein